MIETKEDENKKIRKWLDNYTNAGGFPVTFNLPLETFERVSQYMKGKPFKSFSEAIMFLLDFHPEIAPQRHSQDHEMGKPELPFDSEEMDHS
ncbi:hypothetical protein MUP77_04105 [Candidatus Bathyarchaeota archaeon]|nr:hypothetical protein [Candidatus Bathyarchaeota archaeon]